MTLEAFTGLCLAVAVWSLMCRVYQMDHRVTRPLIIASHFVMAVCAFGALILPMDVGKAMLAAGLAVYLFVSSRRWRGGQPEDTRRPPRPHGAPAPMDSRHFERVSGGAKPPEHKP